MLDIQGIYRVEGFTLDNIHLFPPCKSAARDQTSVLEHASTVLRLQNASYKTSSAP